MHPSDQKYSIAAIRDLLLSAFTVDDLERFCYDRPKLKPLHAKFEYPLSLEKMVGTVITYCDNHALLGELLDEVKEVNLKQYERFEPELLRPDDASASRPSLAGITGEEEARPGMGLRLDGIQMPGCSIRSLVILVSLTLLVVASLGTMLLYDSGLPTSVPDTPTGRWPLSQGFESCSDEGSCFTEVYCTSCSFDEEIAHQGKKALKCQASGGTSTCGAGNKTGGTVSISLAADKSVDFSNVTTISIWVYDTQGDNTVELSLYDASGCVSIGMWSAQPARKQQWTRITWPPSDRHIAEFATADQAKSPGCQGVDLTQITHVELYEWNDGVYYFDDLFVGGPD